jgi:hypothetical protein
VPEKHGTCPGAFSLQVSSDGETWETAAEVKNYHGPFFFSSFHPFVKMIKPRMEFFFHPVKPVQHVRIIVNADGRTPFSVREAYILEDAAEDEASGGLSRLDGEMDRIIDDIASSGRTVIADHWLTACFKKMGRRTDFNPNKFVTNYRVENPEVRGPVPVDLREPSALVCESAFSDENRSVLQKEGIPFEEKGYGYHHAFFTSPAAPAHPLYWDGLKLSFLCRSGGRPPVKPDPFSSLFEQEPLARSCRIDFGGLFRMTAWSAKYAPEKSRVELFFEVTQTKKTTAPYILFVHFCDDKGNILFQTDFQMVDDFGTTDAWIEGRRIVLEHSVDVPVSAKGKRVTLRMGIWEPVSEDVLNVSSEGQSKHELGTLDL